MGQYHLIVNPDKRQFLDPHKFGSGLKLMEFSSDAFGPLAGLSVLLADSNNRGGGDLRSDDPLIGSWAGDRVRITGDYGDSVLGFIPDADRDELAAIAADVYTEGHQQPEKVNLYHYAQSRFEDISDRVIEAVRKAEGSWHPWSKMDLAKDGWRSRPE